MHVPLITGFYAGILGLILVLLTARVIVTRQRERVSLLDGGNPRMTVAIRQQGNFCELVPFALILILVAEVLGSSIYLIHILGIVLVVARLIHPFGLRVDRGDTPPRVLGATLTMIVILVGSVWDIWIFISRILLMPT
jgi:uncharacterized membrane protein YecN with MAPEG domain